MGDQMKNKTNIIQQIKSLAGRLAARELDGGSDAFYDFNKRILEESRKADEILERAADQSGLSQEDKERFFRSNVTTPMSKEDIQALTKVFEILMGWDQEKKVKQ
jgi:predicted solute-binding protein